MAFLRLVDLANLNVRNLASFQRMTSPQFKGDDSVSTRLLVVDPDRTLLDVYCAYFGHFGFQSLTAAVLETAKKHIFDHDIDVVMLEPVLPGDGGNRILRMIASHTRQRPLPVVVVSRRSRYSLAFPIHAYFVKPVALSELMDSIVGAASRRVREDTDMMPGYESRTHVNGG
jgi:DNA-binding response OmpR family regulator